jgi:cell wall-associated NlpC family hydrolase
MVAGLLALTLPAVAEAQRVTVGAAWWPESPQIFEYRLGYGGLTAGPARVLFSAQYLDQRGSSKAHWYGLGADLILRTTPDAIPYLIGGLAVGAGRGPTGGGEDPGIGAWAGVGVEWLALGPTGIQAEALYSWRSKVDFGGISLGLRVGPRLGRKSALEGQPATTPGAAAIPSSNPSDEEVLRLATGARSSGAPAGPIVATALSAMGTPYAWGGTGADGFDCSGLIQYAYSQHGITIPRRSIDQARIGSEVSREVGALLPGDILTFSASPGGSVSHVGLYVGEGQFIHSANGGVMVSQLRSDAASGKWWWDRWLGARRVL